MEEDEETVVTMGLGLHFPGRKLFRAIWLLFSAE
jgi:hypothetical protein